MKKFSASIWASTAPFLPPFMPGTSIENPRLPQKSCGGSTRLLTGKHKQAKRESQATAN